MIEYTASLKDGGRVFDTTDAEKARAEKIFDAKRVYRPLPVVVGEGQVVKGLDEALGGMKVGEERDIELAPDKAFGSRDPGMVRLVPVKVFKQRDINPVPGLPVDFDGRLGRVQTVAGGRVRVDFNHELAGKSLVYKVKVTSKAGSDEEKARFLVERSFNNTDDFKINLAGKKLTVGIPEKAYGDRNLLVRKASLSAELFKYLNLDELTYMEVWKNPKAAKDSKDGGEPKEGK